MQVCVCLCVCFVFMRAMPLQIEHTVSAPNIIHSQMKHIGGKKNPFEGTTVGLLCIFIYLQYLFFVGKKIIKINK